LLQEELLQILQIEQLEKNNSKEKVEIKLVNHI